MLIKNELRDTEFANCKALEKVGLLNCSSAVDKINNSTERLTVIEEEQDNEIVNLFEQALFDEEIDVWVRDISEFNLQTVTYIAGFVVDALVKKWNAKYVSGLLADSINSCHRFIMLKNKGGLIFPSNDVVNI